MVNINELVLSVILACLALIFLKHSLYLNAKYIVFGVLLHVTLCIKFRWLFFIRFNGYIDRF